MKTLALFGPMGMLGSAVYGVLRAEYKLVLVLRDIDRLPILDKAYGGVSEHRSVHFDSDALQAEYTAGFPTQSEPQTWRKLVHEIGTVDGVVNCIGVTNRFSQQQPLVAYFINSAFPYLLAHTYGSKLLHITTDCAYNGNAGAPYTEESIPSPTDLYGLTKMLGEPANRSLVFRTSIIGPEISGFVSLLEWVRKQEGKTISGYTKHLWNGVTTKQFGTIAQTIFRNRDAFPTNGLFHIFGTDTSKFDLVSMIAKKYGVNVRIVPDDTTALDRRLRTVKELNEQLRIPNLQSMIDEMDLLPM